MTSNDDKRLKAASDGADGEAERAKNVENREGGGVHFTDAETVVLPAPDNSTMTGVRQADGVLVVGPAGMLSPFQEQILKETIARVEAERERPRATTTLYGVDEATEPFRVEALGPTPDQQALIDARQKAHDAIVTAMVGIPPEKLAESNAKMAEIGKALVGGVSCPFPSLASAAADRAERIARVETAAAYEAGAESRTAAKEEVSVPYRIARLPKCPKRNIPVPWFVAWIDGVPDFRIVDPAKLVEAHRKQKCFMCGDLLHGRRAFAIGPMCACNRISSEPPSHPECAEYAVKVCPFLTKPHMRRRTAGMPEEVEEAAGLGHPRNPGVILVWQTHTYRVVPDQNGRGLFRVGHPLAVEWYTQGRLATRQEASKALMGGVEEVTLPMAIREGPTAVAALQTMLDDAWKLLPKRVGWLDEEVPSIAPRLVVDPAAYISGIGGIVPVQFKNT